MKLFSILLLAVCLSVSCSKEDDPKVPGAGAGGAGGGGAGGAGAGGLGNPIIITANEINDNEREFLLLIEDSLNSREPIEVGMQKVVHNSFPYSSYFEDASGNKTLDLECVINQVEKHTVVSLDNNESRTLIETLSFSAVDGSEVDRCEEAASNFSSDSYIEVARYEGTSTIYSEIEETFLGSEIVITELKNIVDDIYEIKLIAAENGFEKFAIVSQFDMSEPYFFSHLNNIMNELPTGKLVNSDLIVETEYDVDVTSFDLNGLEEVNLDE